MDSKINNTNYMPQEIDALFISDVHLGSKGSKAEELLQTLKLYKPKTLYLVGDIIDGWLLKRRHFWPQSHTNVIRKILSFSKNGAQVVYITGNHDDFLRSYDHLDFGNIIILDEIIVEGVLITHGDKWDTVIMWNKWIGVLGSIGYEITLVINEWIKKIRSSLGLRPKSFSKWIKSKVKNAVAFISSFETTLAKEAKSRGCHAVICGHIHTMADKNVDGIHYLNTGDWIENCSWITLDKGVWELHSLNP